MTKYRAQICAPDFDKKITGIPMLVEIFYVSKSPGNFDLSLCILQPIKSLQWMTLVDQVHCQDRGASVPQLMLPLLVWALKVTVVPEAKVRVQVAVARS